jgi:TonB-dependent starch-binding outer membrane protein SusC
MKNSLFKCFQAFALLLCVNVTFSQTVSGVVSDAKGPLPGVSILIKGSTNGTQTDLNGAYSIKGATNETLVFSYIGFKTQEVRVGSKSTINVQMVEESSKLSEVLVIGYGTVKRKDATGAVDQISSKNFDNISATSPGELLRGKLAGVQVTQSSGEPGAGLAVRIRGNSSVRSGNEPLIVVDGIPLSGGDLSPAGAEIVGLGSSSARNPLNFVNQNDIESISILKDASSTAIYGSRGANGVVLITTKKGKSKQPELNFNSNVSVSNYSSKFKLLSSDDYVRYGGADLGSRSYDWEKDILQTGLTVNNDVSFSSGTDKSNTRLSFGANNTEGIVKNTGIDRYSVTLFNSNDFFDGILKVDSRILYAGIKDRTTLTTNNVGYIGNVIGTALYWNPTNSIYKPNGSYNVVANDFLNPVQLLNSYNDFTNTGKILGSITAKLRLSKSFNYQFVFGIENSTAVRKREILPTIQIKDVATAQVPGTGTDNVTNPAVFKYGQADIFNISKFNKTFEHLLNFNKDFSENLGIEAVGGFSYYSYDSDGYTSSGKGYNADQTDLINNIEGGLEREFRANSFKNKVELQSVFLRSNFTLLKKLIISGSFRSDGSSKLGENRKFGGFYGAGMAIKAIENKEGIINNIKIRGNYGTTGNQEFAVYSASPRASFGLNGNIAEQVNPNPNLKWETTVTYGGGIDFELFSNRLSGSFDIYQRETKDLIFPIQAGTTQPSPNGLRYENLDGTLQNKGLEVSLNYKIVENDNFAWDIAANTSFNSNKIKDFRGFIQSGGLNGQGLSGAYAQVVTNDYPIYTYYLLDFKGYDSTGNSIYTDDDGNNVSLGLATKKFLDKTPLPKMNIGFSTNISYKGLDATVSFYGAYGHYIYNNTSNAYFFKGAFNGGRNVTEDVATSNQSVGDPNSASTKYLEKGDFLRMGNLTLGYTFKGGVFERAKIKSARFYVNGQNLLLFTNYTGFDPEVDTDKTLNGVPSAGIDYLSYPRAKSFACGLNLTF